MDAPRKGGVTQERFLVAMRPEPASADVGVTAKLLGLKPEMVRDVFGGGWPRIIASRASLADAESLARVLTARGREAVAWDREFPLVELLHAERFQVEADHFLLEVRGRAQRVYPAQRIERVVDVRLRPDPRAPPSALPDRALLVVPTSGGGLLPGVFSTWSAETGDVPRPQLAASQLVQEASRQARGVVKEKLVEMRTTLAAMGVEDEGEAGLERMLQLIARLPPQPSTPPVA